MALVDTFGSDVRPWLKLVEDLRNLNLDAELNVPQICVMGDQSSGKSSVLEALSGIPFPRGSGLVTRCPIRLVMRKAREHESWFAVVSTSVDPSTRIPVSEITALSSVIERLTSTLCQGSSQFSTESIVIDLVSPDACDLTVVDLPGIIRTVTAGQSVSVIDQVNRLIKSFLIDRRTIILAVIPANQVDAVNCCLSQSKFIL
jgi:interferon-induced GTP-binding protein Mx1